MAQLNEGKPVRALDLSKEEKANLRQFFLITEKPVRLPGQGGMQRRAEQLARGVALHPTIAAMLQPGCARYGCPFPAPL